MMRAQARSAVADVAEKDQRLSGLEDEGRALAMKQGECPPGT